MFRYTSHKFYKIRNVKSKLLIKRLNSSTGTLKSNVSKLIIPEQLIHEYTWENIGLWYNRTAVTCFATGKCYSYGQIYYKSQILANMLQTKFHLKQGDVVAIILPNVPEFPIAFFGVIQAGLVVTTVNPHYTTSEMSTQLVDSNSKLIITTTELCSIVSKAIILMKRDIPIIATGSKDLPHNYIKLEDLCIGRPMGRGPNTSCSIKADDVAFLPYSSGTTGLPKGVQLTHKNVVTYIRCHRIISKSMNTQKVDLCKTVFLLSNSFLGDFQEVIPVFLPIFHIYGLVGVFLNYIAKGCRLIMIQNFVGAQFVKLLHNYRPTLLFVVPPIFNLILNSVRIRRKDLETVRCIVSAASPLGTAVVEEFNMKTQERIDILQMYGMTETSPLTIMQTKKIPIKGTKIGGSGLLLPNTEARVIATDGFDETLGPFRAGELLVKGPQIMKGYHNNRKATNKVLENGWLRTGDVCYYDDDQHFFITDRLKELIEVKGFQVAPAELEEILCTHSEVEDAAVVGVPHSLQGEAPKAFVVLKPWSSMKVEELKGYVASKVANYKRLVGGVEIIDRIPRNAAGKILRKKLKG